MKNIEIQSIRNRIRKAKDEMAEKSFIAKDKSIHFGALQVVYVRDALKVLEDLEKFVLGEDHE